MTIYLILRHDWEDTEVIGAYSNKASAEQAMEKLSAKDNAEDHRYIPYGYKVFPVEVSDC